MPTRPAPARPGTSGSAPARALRALLATRPWQRPNGVRAGALVDPPSGLLIDGFVEGALPIDLELLGALARDLVQAGPLITRAGGGRSGRMLLETAPSRYLLIASARDPRGDPPLVALLVDGSWRRARRTGRRLADDPVLRLDNAQGRLPRRAVPRNRWPTDPDGPPTVRIPRPRPYADPSWSPGGRPRPGPRPSPRPRT